MVPDGVSDFQNDISNTDMTLDAISYFPLTFHVPSLEDFMAYVAWPGATSIL